MRAGHRGKNYLFCNMRAALRVIDPREAVIVAMVFRETDVVATLNVADRAPAGISSFDGTLACAD